MAVTATREDNRLIIKFSGAFDFNARNDFLQAYSDAPSDLAFELDFRRCNSVDSSALGLLMVFREFAGGENSDITITGCSEQLLNLFRVAQFHSIYNIK